jgi:KDO2-lipid IV(A) lauroyltransferase
MADTGQRLQFIVFSGVKALLFILPRQACLLSGKLLGLAFYHLDKKHRSMALANLKIAFGKERQLSELKRIARRSFIHFGRVMLDIIKFSRLSDERKASLLRIEGEENLMSALEQKRGGLLFSAHYGNWEITPHFLSTRGKLSVVARPLDNMLIEKVLLKIRTRLGAEVIYKHQATKKILQSLQQRGMVAFLIDQSVLRQQAVFVDFFGKKAATTPSLAAFHLRTGAPLVPAFCYPTSSYSYHLKILRPLVFRPEGDYERQVLKITQICTNIIEAQIRQNPDYWFWLHNRWRIKSIRQENES